MPSILPILALLLSTTAVSESLPFEAPPRPHHLGAATLVVVFDGLETQDGCGNDPVDNCSEAFVGTVLPHPGSPEQQAEIVAEMRRVLAPYGVTVTDQRPENGPYEMVVFGEWEGETTFFGSIHPGPPDCGDAGGGVTSFVVGVNTLPWTQAHHALWAWGIGHGLEAADDPDDIMHPSSTLPDRAFTDGFPVVEISFGDGHAIKTTTTGNSIHYLLGGDGTVLDAAPGLYSPDGFADVLGSMLSLWAEVTAAGADADAADLRYHAWASEASLGKVSRWLDEHGRPVGATSWASAAGQLSAQPQALALALDAQITTASKASVEVPVLRALGAAATPQQTTEEAREQVFDHLAEAGVIAVDLSEPTLALLRRDRPLKPGESESDYTARMSAMRQAFESSIARDELQNEYHLRIALHRWLADPTTDRSFEAFNERVYRELFMTPASDPWLGLVDDTTYDGLVEAGIARLPG